MQIIKLLRFDIFSYLLRSVFFQTSSICLELQKYNSNMKAESIILPIRITTKLTIKLMEHSRVR